MSAVDEKSVPNSENAIDVKENDVQIIYIPPAQPQENQLYLLTLSEISFPPNSIVETSEILEENHGGNDETEESSDNEVEMETGNVSTNVESVPDIDNMNDDELCSQDSVPSDILDSQIENLGLGCQDTTNREEVFLPQNILSLLESTVDDKHRMDFIARTVIESLLVKANLPHDSEKVDELKDELNSMKQSIMKRFAQRVLQTSIATGTETQSVATSQSADDLSETLSAEDKEPTAGTSQELIGDPLKGINKRKYPVKLQKGVFGRANAVFKDSQNYGKETSARKVAQKLFDSVMTTYDIANCTMSGKTYKNKDKQVKKFKEEKVAFIREGLEFIFARPAIPTNAEFIKVWKKGALQDLPTGIWEHVRKSVLQTYANEQRAKLSKANC